MNAVLLALLLLQVKHFAGDFVLQSSRQARFKGIYGHRAGLEHAGTHAALTIPCLLAVGISPRLALAAAAIEFVIHYHEDWFKARISRRIGLMPDGRAYWAMFGADQLVHQLTYLAMAGLLLTSM